MRSQKILLVDDSDTVLMMERMILKTAAYELVMARNGKEALKMATAEKPDLILLGVMMPEMDGFEACRRLREMQEMRATPIIMVTTRGEEENVEAGFTSGCNDYITKPIDNFELLSKVRNLLGS